MPYQPSFYTDFFFEPLTEDVEELLSRFQRMDSVRYGVFSAIWRDMRFSDIFVGMSSSCEMKRLCHVALATAVKYFLPPYSYQIRVGGLYLMFAFYHTQRACVPLKIRLALKDWGHVQSFLKESTEAEHHDVVYIYHKLAVSKAFHYTAMPHLLRFQKQQTQKTSLDKQFLGKAVALQELQSTDILDEMGEIQSLYEKQKKACVEVNVKVNMIHPDLTPCLNKWMSEFITWQQKVLPKEEKARDDEIDETPEDDCSSRARLLSSIKQKSYSNVQKASKSRRHREVEKVENSSSGGEQFQQPSSRNKHISLRARTWKNLGKKEGGSSLAWLLSTPEFLDEAHQRRMSQNLYVEYKMKEEAG